MQIKIFKDYTDMSAAAAKRVVECIKNKPDATLCFATGDTPRLCYAKVVEMVKEEKADISKCFFIGLDEWLGIPMENTGSCHYFLHHYLFGPLQIPSSQIHLFNAIPANEKEECDRMNAIIAERKGIDLVVAGVGMNGHIGFNEPGTNMNTEVHIKELDEMTRNVGQKYFSKATDVRKGITVGLKQIMNAGTLLVIANGRKKAMVIKRTMQDEIGTDFPATLIRQHRNGILMTDSEAACELETELR